MLARIRQEPGLTRFLQSPPIDELRKQADKGPVVLLNASRYRCDALILVSDADRPVRVVELSALTRYSVIDQANRFRSATSAAASRSPAERTHGQREMVAILEWLWDEIAGPILDELGFTGPPPSDNAWPRLWWCPIGETAFLPVHAAGYHSDIGDRGSDAARADAPRTVLDRVISSYTPTISALRYAQRGHDDAAGAPPGHVPCGAVIVAMSTTPGASPLPGAQREADRLNRRCRSDLPGLG